MLREFSRSTIRLKELCHERDEALTDVKRYVERSEKLSFKNTVLLSQNHCYLAKLVMVESAMLEDHTETSVHTNLVGVHAHDTFSGNEVDPGGANFIYNE